MIPSSVSNACIDRSPILSFLQFRHKKPLVFLPNYGEFGSTVVKLIKIVHFSESSKKIVCCRPGEESYFPDADEFFYDWNHFVKDEHRWGFFTKKKLCTKETYTEYQKLLSEDFDRIREHFGEDYEYVHLWKFSLDREFDRFHHHFVFSLSPRIRSGISADVVISPRNKMSRKENNFTRWECVVDELNRAGYSVGCVGSKDLSMVIPNCVNSWDYPDNSSAVIELLSNCKLYIGLDTGVSHLAAFMSVPMIVFSHSAQKHYYTNFMRDITRVTFIDLGKFVTNTNMITDTAIKHLSRM